jgi:hypothetical protein
MVAPFNRISTSRISTIVLGMVIVLASIALAVYSQQGNRFDWTPDGFKYARMMLMDRGVSEEAADVATREFYRTKATTVKDLSLFSANPPDFFRQSANLFRGRLVYPYIASLLYPRFGFQALHIVSALAYIFAVFIMYVMLLPFASPWIAAFGALTFAATGTVRLLSGSDSTDVLGLMFWMLILIIMIQFVSSGKLLWLALFALVCILLVFTRPIIFLPLGGSLAVVVLGALTRNRGFTRNGFLLTGIVVIVGITYLASHFPGAREQLRWYYQWQTEAHYWPLTSFPSFYIHYVTRAFGFETRHLFADGLVPIVAVATLAFYLHRREPVTAILVGGCVAALTVFFVNPHEPELRWGFEMPLMPALTVGFVMAVTSLLRVRALALARAA